MPLKLRERQAVINELVPRYRKASKRDKGVILDQVRELTGYNRSYASRALRRSSAPKPVSSKVSRPRSGRPPVYGDQVRQVLIKIWAIMTCPCGKRLAPFMGELVSALERHSELSLDPTVRSHLLTMSAATIDRLLAPERRRMSIKGKTGTKPGSLLKRNIPIRTFAEWDDHRPGFIEIDLVGHDGGNTRGDYAQTLDMVDVATGWTETAAVKNKAQRWVFEAIQRKRESFPFPLLGIDSDNGSEFINDQLLRFCGQHHLTFTRSRPGWKNDNCYVEQKNWVVVRKMVGYERHDTPEQLAALNQLYDPLRLYTNFFQPQQKLVKKERNGARVRRTYDSAKTPYQRIMASPDIPESTKVTLTEQYYQLNPAALRRELLHRQQILWSLTHAPSDDAQLTKEVAHNEYL